MQNVVKIGVAGLGTVGAGTVKLLSEHRDNLADRSGSPMIVTAVSARDRTRDRGFSTEGITWYEDARDLATDKNVDVVVETIGGSNGIAYDVCKAALENGKHVVTANKALIALHGVELARIADANNVTIAYEAAVAGGIPVIKALREGLAGNAISRVTGILNGTCNYILTTMREQGRDFADVLAEAQKLGYAEADPTFDVDGIDAAHKLAILTSLAFGVEVDFDAIAVEGIRSVSALDIQLAEELGYRIKLLAIAKQTPEGIEQRVSPVLVDRSTQISKVEGVFNAVVLEGDYVGPVVLQGRGAGERPTASAVVADLVDIAAGRNAPVFGVPADRLKKNVRASLEKHVGPYYLRLMVWDRPGVMAEVTATLAKHGVSMASMIQHGRAETEGGVVPVVFVTHETSEAAMSGALSDISAFESNSQPPVLMRIEGFTS
ncbi:MULTISPECIES: homoserine dehydrogenase [Thalassospira]|uniref:Homoserine dehydrogenase n=1 Tax=Thalassospira xiamenensis TaxID=220697 RepID=A0A154KZT3_9PROT|nr:homoserine dehydrogenase [Thalassospira xiamenensis]MBO9509751.1 homoserine dehydrogenase [Thalassospira sp. A3_1]KZB57793.1 homoserine dehydrogenase [Thalassospira xiamenensis]RCK33394.1 homoserine dehydrogenase [Thalassospira xiamenensis]RCK45182.1 homoserine dehydrogenase [Thalassospira xiamenensis]SOB93062.1 homoserine dehydrogenase [Thalassospira xiamenensis]